MAALIIQMPELTSAAERFFHHLDAPEAASDDNGDSESCRDIGRRSAGQFADCSNAFGLSRCSTGSGNSTNQHQTTDDIFVHD